METLRLGTPDHWSGAAPHDYVLVDPGSEAETLWRERGLVAEGEVAEQTDTTDDEPVRRRPGRKPKGAEAR